MKNLLYALFVGVCLYVGACTKDKGNYNYHAINEISFSAIDTANGYTVYIGDSLKISPVLISSLPGTGTPDYSYEWSFYDISTGDRVISTEKDLQIRVAELPGSYPLQYRVTDKNTGVLFHTRTILNVRTEVYEGYMVLNNVEGKSRMDMLSYDATTGSFNQFTNVLAKMASSLPEQGAPIQVLCTRSRNAFNYSDSTYGIYLLTENGTNRVHPETFDWRPTYDVRYEVVGDIPAGFKADKITVSPAQYYITMMLSSGNQNYTRTFGAEFYTLPVNKYLGQPPFKASPYIVSGESQYVAMFDMDKHAFALMQQLNGNVAIPMPSATQPGEINFPTGHSLVYMAKTPAEYAYAVTKTAAGVYYLTKFVPGALPSYSKPIKGTDLDKATNWAVGANPEYLFYSAGGKLYEYDLYLESSKLMLDKGSSIISYLAFQPFSQNRNPGTYGIWKDWLTVGSYNPAGISGSNGTLEQFAVPDANDPLQLKKSWTGFGQIVSASYRER